MSEYENVDSESTVAPDIDMPDNAAARRPDGSSISGAKHREILLAIESLTRRGKKVDQKSIRDEMGGGSYATIAPVLREYRRGMPAPEATDTPLPLRVTSELNQFGRGLWDAALHVANSQFQQDRAELRQQAAELERTELAYEGEIREWQATAAGLSTQLEASDQEKRNIETSLRQQEAANSALMQEQRVHAENIASLTDELSSANAELRSTHDALNKMTIDRDRHAELASALDQQLAEVKGKLDVEQKEREELRRHNTHIEGELQSSRAESESLAARLACASEEIARLQAEVAPLTLRADELSAELVQLQEKQSELDATVEALRAALTRSTQQKDELAAQLAEAHAQGLEARAENKETKAELAHARADNKEYRAELKELRAKFDAVTQELLAAVQKREA